jgi:beta-lactamase regulating signal transducer with metallopeptidase domain
MRTALEALVTTPAGMSWLVSCAIKAALLLAASWAGAALLRRGPAAARHQLWTLGVIGALVLPVLCWLVPSLTPSAATVSTASSSSFVANAVLVTAGAVPAAAPTWPAWLALVWAAGTFVVAVRLVRGHLAARRLVRTAVPSTVETWSVALREAAASIGLDDTIELRRSETIGSPMTIGVVRPRVLLPAAADAWSAERLRAVLVHELGHVRRRDTLVQLAAQIGTALYWWNPLAWMAARRLRIEREHACDDLVLAAGIRPSSYAGDLLDVARDISLDASAHAGASCMVDRSWTEARLGRILDASAPRRPVRTRFRVGAIGVALACSVMLACTSNAPVLSKGDKPADVPAPRGTLSVGMPSLREPAGTDFPPSLATYPPPANRGAVDLSLVAAEVKRRMPTLEHCYASRLAAKPALAGTVVIHWVIEESGKVAEACITEDTVDDRDITDCVNALVQAGPFPAPKGGAVDVSFPFVFAASPTVAAAR